MPFCLLLPFRFRRFGFLTHMLVVALAEASHRKTEEIGADDFLPGLIYLLLRSNPPLLYSNLRYALLPPLHSLGEAGLKEGCSVCGVLYEDTFLPSATRPVE